MPKPYEKHVLNKGIAVAAICEPYLFSNIAIKEAVEKSECNYGDNNTGIEDNTWRFYDLSGNPISLEFAIPDNFELCKVDKFTVEDGFDQNLADYFNEDGENVWSEVYKHEMEWN